MRLIPDEDLITICREIVAAGKTEKDWAASESDDMFQRGSYCGGFDADENEFCFETVVDGVEYWFQFSLNDAARIADGEAVTLEAREAG
ncbi:hypothetical protein D6779_09940 [Candidatus Parcubacteria bacterium]|nr:MAG: hypothetical protein D6779_09940 [Candidatus Parcubacteria bacterium]